MGKPLLSEAAFNRAVVNRAKRERPDIRVQSMGKDLLWVESRPGHWRVISTVGLYQIYCEAPQYRDEVVGAFLANQVYVEGAIEGTFEENRSKLMPLIVPRNVTEQFRVINRELATLHLIGDLRIAFVVDEPEACTFIHQQTAHEWNVTEMTLLKAAMANLQDLNADAEPLKRFGKGEHTFLLWETFDGYDASRVLLTSELIRAAVTLGGNPVIAVPNRDYLIMFGDTDPEYVQQMAEMVQEQYDRHACPISPHLLTLVEGNLLPYTDRTRRERVVN
ncbi:MAG TPA: DUF1444 family protein [Symbiobacteriaceae bacterium]|jgi:uncharacterized protein YtpQ (UPF0354 family)|nr:DUF1444 family protein [Symbiobacteriaceae bacterium]